MGLQFQGGTAVTSGSGYGGSGHLKQRLQRTTSEHTMCPNREFNSRSKNGTNVWSNALDVYL